MEREGSQKKSLYNVVVVVVIIPTFMIQQKL